MSAGTEPDRRGEDRSTGFPPGQAVRYQHKALHYGPVPTFRPERWDLRVVGATEDLSAYRWTHEEFQELPRTESVSDFHCVMRFSVPQLRWSGVSTLDLATLAPPSPEATHVMVWGEYGYSANLRMSDFLSPSVSDFHCVMRFSVPQMRWSGVSTLDLAALAPPSPEATHVMVWGEYGYSANLRISDFLSPSVLLATHRDGRPLDPEHGHPLRMVVPHLYGWKSVKWLRMVEYMTADRRGFWEERGYHNRADPWLEQRFSAQEGPGDGPAL